MKLIVDTNIVFSSILNTDSKIGDLLLNSDDQFEFYSVSYLKDEFENHKAKLSQISNLSLEEIDQIKTQIFAKIQFISEDLIPFEFWRKAVDYVREVDMDDMRPCQRSSPRQIRSKPTLTANPPDRNGLVCWHVRHSQSL